MGRKRRGDPVHGWIIIDKPIGLSSSAVVGRVRYLLSAQKAGHGGTLDPLATGVLPIALGEATKTVSYIMDGEKAYDFMVRWGEARDTDDAEGDVVETSDHRPSSEEIQDALPAFIGDVEQVPPDYSAVKVKGQRAYKLARADAPVKLEPRTVTIRRLELLSQPDRDHAEFRARCGKGTYVRSLARDIAVCLSTVGHVARLRRTAVGPFEESRAISLDYLETLGHSARDSEILLPIETALDDIPALALTEQEARKLRNGQALPVLPVINRSPQKDISQGATVCAMVGGKLVALACIKGGEIRPLRVMNL